MSASHFPIAPETVNAAPEVAGLRLQVFTSLADIQSDWQKLEVEGLSTVYQTFAWCSTWLQHVGHFSNISPLIICAYDNADRVKFILPLQFRRKWGFRIIEWLSYPQAGYGFGLFERRFLAEGAGEWFKDNFAAVAALLPVHDVLRLAELPLTVNAMPNPLLSLRHFRCANQSHIMDLYDDYDALYEHHRSRDSRRSIRKRDNHLIAMGDITFDIATDREQRHQTIQTMFHHQQLRLSEAGIHDVFSPAERAFILSLADQETVEGKLLRPYRLLLNGEILAVTLGAYYQNRFWALITSLAPGETRRHSPGDFALRAMIKSLCEDGTKTLDFSAGDTSYKLHWADRHIPLYAIVNATGFKGLPAAIFLLLREKLKGVAKRTPQINSLLMTLRRRLFGRSPPNPD